VRASSGSGSLFGLHLVLDGATLDASASDWLTLPLLAPISWQYYNASFIIGVNSANGFFRVRAGSDISIKAGQQVRRTFHIDSNPNG